MTDYVCVCVGNQFPSGFLIFDLCVTVKLFHVCSCFCVRKICLELEEILKAYCLSMLAYCLYILSLLMTIYGLN